MEMAAAGAAAGAIGSLVATSGVVVCGLAEELLGPSTRVGKVAGFGDPTLANTSRMAGFILDAEHAPFCHTRQVTVVRVLAERGLDQEHDTLVALRRAVARALAVLRRQVHAGAHAAARVRHDAHAALHDGRHHRGVGTMPQQLAIADVVVFRETLALRK
jgi:hypothetical protein